MKFCVLFIIAVYIIPVTITGSYILARRINSFSHHYNLTQILNLTNRNIHPRENGMTSDYQQKNIHNFLSSKSSSAHRPYLETPAESSKSMHTDGEGSWQPVQSEEQAAHIKVEPTDGSLILQERRDIGRWRMNDNEM